MNWEQLILRLIVPISFVAIWALTAIFNRDAQEFPPRPNGPIPPGGPRPGEPTVRWGPPPASPNPGPRRVSLGDDDILIIPGDPSRPARPAAVRSLQSSGMRKPAKPRPGQPAPKKIEPPAQRAKLSGVSQNVNQSLARPVGLTPLTAITPMTLSTGSDLANAPSAPSKTSALLTVSTILPLMHDPVRLRESFIVNELFQAPVALRGRRGHRR